MINRIEVSAAFDEEKEWLELVVYDEGNYTKFGDAHYTLSTYDAEILSMSVGRMLEQLAQRRG